MAFSSLNKIGSFSFIELHRSSGGDGPPQGQQQRSEVIQRRGVDGVAIRRDGSGAEPFAMTAGRDCTNATASQEFLVQYKALENQAPVDLIYNGVNRGRFFVRSVHLVSEAGISAGSGGFHGSSAGVYQRTEWELIAVE